MDFLPLLLLNQLSWCKRNCDVLWWQSVGERKQIASGCLWHDPRSWNAHTPVKQVDNQLRLQMDTIFDKIVAQLYTMFIENASTSIKECGIWLIFCGRPNARPGRLQT